MSIFIFDIVALIACHSLRNFPSQKILLALRDAINNPLSLSFIFSSGLNAINNRQPYCNTLQNLSLPSVLLPKATSLSISNYYPYSYVAKKKAFINKEFLFKINGPFKRILKKIFFIVFIKKNI